MADIAPLLLARCCRIVLCWLARRDDATRNRVEGSSNNVPPMHQSEWRLSQQVSMPSGVACVCPLQTTTTAAEIASPLHTSQIGGGDRAQQPPDPADE